MKKIINYSGIPGLVLIAALAFMPFSCSKEAVKENPLTDNSSQLIKVSGEDAGTATKTTLVGLVTSWKADDQVGIYSPLARTTLGGGTAIANVEFHAASSGVSSNFTGTMYWGAANTPHIFYAYYPYNIDYSGASNVVPITLSDNQIQLEANSNAHIGALDFMIATPKEVTSPGSTAVIENTQVSLRYNHVFTVLEFQIKGSETLTAVKLSGSNALAFSGGTIDITQTTPETGIYTITGQTGINQVEVTLTTPAPLSTTATSVYMVINPGTQTGNCLIGLYDGTTWTYISKEAPVMTSDPLVRGFLRGKKYVVAIDKANASTVPVLTTTAASEITTTTATSGGNITSDGGATVTARGVCWSIFISPEIVLNSKTTDGVGTGAFTSSITELTAGTVYYVRAYATNSIGTAYGDQLTLTAATVPGAPTIGTATAGNALAVVAFTAPVSDGGFAITGYTVTSNSGNITGTGSASPITVSGLTNGTAYTFTVTATNTIGTSVASSASNSVTPVAPSTAPGAPTIGTATAGNAQATVTFTAPVSNGGSAITSYTATSTPGSFTGTLIQAGSGTITVTGLTNLTAYTFTVTATNAIGTGAASASSNSVIPGTVTSADSRIWMDRNLGATQVATSSTDVAAYGNLYQWGRAADGHQFRTSGTTSTLSNTDTPGHANFILAPNTPFDWRNGQNVSLWQVSTGTNNPCPSGFRIPTNDEFIAEIATWSAKSPEGAFASPLKLPVAGHRLGTSGSFLDAGSTGYYWSSTVSGISSLFLVFYGSSAYMAGNYRADGLSVRCIKN